MLAHHPRKTVTVDMQESSGLGLVAVRGGQCQKDRVPLDFGQCLDGGGGR